MGDPDLSPPGPDRPTPHPGLVVFPIESLAPPATERNRRTGLPLGEWWVVVAALGFAAVVVSIALLLR